MKTLVYANTAEKARAIVAWVGAIARQVPAEVTVQVLEGASPVEVEASRILREGLSPDGGVRALEVKAGGGSPEEAIAARAAEGDYALVALAPAGRRGFIRLFYGSMIAHVVQRVSTSVLVVRPEAAFPPKRILVGVSGSRHSLTNVTVASQFALLFGADLTLITVLSQVSVEGAAEPALGEAAAFLGSDHPAARQLRIASEIARKVGARVEVRVREGLIADEVAGEIRRGGHDLLVVGTHRSEDFDTVYEDITNELVQSSTVSTLVVGLRAALL